MPHVVIERTGAASRRMAIQMNLIVEQPLRKEGPADKVFWPVTVADMFAKLGSILQASVTLEQDR